MDESIWTGVLIVAIIFFAGMAAWLGENYRKWRIRRMKRRKVLGSAEKHINLKG